MDELTRPLEDFINDIVNCIDMWTRSDLQGHVSARCMETGENDDEILQMIDKRTIELYDSII